MPLLLFVCTKSAITRLLRERMESKENGKEFIFIECECHSFYLFVHYQFYHDGLWRECLLLRDTKWCVYDGRRPLRCRSAMSTADCRSSRYCSVSIVVLIILIWSFLKCRDS